MNTPLIVFVVAAIVLLCCGAIMSCFLSKTQREYMALAIIGTILLGFVAFVGQAFWYGHTESTTVAQNQVGANPPPKFIQARP